MAISLVASWANSNASGGTLPAHQAGDLILVFAFRNDGTVPGLAGGAGYTSVATGGSGSFVWRLAYQIAPNAGVDPGTWGGADYRLYQIYRGAGSVGGWSERFGAGASDIVYGNSQPMTIANGSSWVVGFCGARDTTINAGTAPAGMVNRQNYNGATNKGAAHDTNGGVSSWPDTSVIQAGTGSPWRTVVVELTAPRTGTLAFIESNDGTSAMGGPDRLGSLTFTEAADGSAATMLPARSGALVFAEASGAVAGSARLGRVASLAFSEGADDLDAAGLRGIVGGLAFAENDDAVAATFKPIVISSLALTESADTSSASALLGRIGSLTFTEAADGSASEIVSSRIGVLVFTEGADALSASSLVERCGAVSFSEGDDALTSSTESTRAGVLDFLENGDPSEGSAALLISGTADFTEDDDILASGTEAIIGGALNFIEADDLAFRLPDVTDPIPSSHCIDVADLVEASIDRVLTQYRESPNLLFLMRNYLGQAAELQAAICALPEYFDLDTAAGDQLTLIGKRLGFGRCHCVCKSAPVFGFACGNQPFGTSIVGFCVEGSIWTGCGQNDVAEICIDDDEMYRRLLKVRRYQFRRLYDMDSLTTAVRTLYGDAARIVAAGHGRVVVAPYRALTDAEIDLLQVVPRILPVAPGIAVRFHFGLRPIFGFGEGWPGFCLNDLAPPAGADWLCPVDTRPYSC